MKRKRRRGKFVCLKMKTYSKEESLLKPLFALLQVTQAGITETALVSLIDQETANEFVRAGMVESFLVAF